MANGRPFTNDELETAQKMRAGGYTYAAIAEVLDRQPYTIQFHLNPKLRAWRREYHRKKSVENWHKQKNDPLFRAKMALNTGRKNARKRGHAPCTASPETVAAGWTGTCFVCGTPEDECTSRLCMDHCHETGEFRGWACARCNHVIGMIESFPGIVQKALQLKTTNV